MKKKKNAALVNVARKLKSDVDALRFGPPITHVYNPLDYAWAPHEQYLRRYGSGRREVVLVGMNPGPWGMVQTGVPFGDVSMVRDWMGIEAPVDKPEREHPKRPVDGFACHRAEQSGRRLWGWARERFGSPERFFARFFVLNYCPLCFFEEGGQNRTPDKLRRRERERLFAVCDEALEKSAQCLEPEYVVGIGRFAASRIEAVLKGKGIKVGAAPHPSPASPMANRGWAELMEGALEMLSVSITY